MSERPSPGGVLQWLSGAQTLHLHSSQSNSDFICILYFEVLSVQRTHVAKKKKKSEDSQAREFKHTALLPLTLASEPTFSRQFLILTLVVNKSSSLRSIERIWRVLGTG